MPGKYELMKDFTVAIVGAGPIGIEMSVALKKEGIDFIHFDSGQIGQTISWYPEEARFFSSPERIAISGIPLLTPGETKATKEQYLAYLRGVSIQFELKIRTFEKVIGIEKKGNIFLIRTQSSHFPEKISERLVRYVILATGDMHDPKIIGVPGEDLPHVSHYFESPGKFLGKKLLIVGGKNSAVEAAIRCHRAGANVSISYRKSQFDPESIKYWILPEINSFIKSGQIGFFPGTLPKGIYSGTVILRKNDGIEFEIEADFVLLLTGYKLNPELFLNSGVQFSPISNAPVFNPETMETNIAGIYIAGTTAAGTQSPYRLFIENAHEHVSKILSSITGKIKEKRENNFEFEES